ncbi:MAG TPA: hypothetical protein PKV06_15590, partial [bacterium]|nr:hypothetical protein [bacterium]
IDTTFGTNGKVTISFDLGGNGANQDSASCVQIQSDGKIVIGGYAQRDGYGKCRTGRGISQRHHDTQ